MPKNTSEQIAEEWNEICKSWDAVARDKYYSKILSPLENCVSGIEINNVKLEQYAKNCILKCQ